MPEPIITNAADAMPEPTSHLFAYVRTVSDFRPEVTAIVIFGLEVRNDDPVYLLIRFEDYAEFQIEGDHLILGLDEALESARFEYGILPSDWREMSEAEIHRIDSKISFSDLSA